MLCHPILRNDRIRLVSANETLTVALGQGWPQRLLGSLVGVGLWFAWPTAVQAQSCEVLLTSPQSLNTEQRDEVIHIGALPWRPYLVILPGADAEQLTEVRACVPDAYLSQSRLGPFVQVGSFTTRAEAEVIHRQFQRVGYDTRLIHRRGIAAF
ncbi:MAG: hypothetical protein AAFQ61_08370 [Cyanobacteria bacterium J06626_23]